MAERATKRMLLGIQRIRTENPLDAPPVNSKADIATAVQTRLLAKYLVDHGDMQVVDLAALTPTVRSPSQRVGEWVRGEARFKWKNIINQDIHSSMDQFFPDAMQPAEVPVAPPAPAPPTLTGIAPPPLFFTPPKQPPHLSPAFPGFTSPNEATHIVTRPDFTTDAEKASKSAHKYLKGAPKKLSFPPAFADMKPMDESHFAKVNETKKIKLKVLSQLPSIQLDGSAAMTPTPGLGQEPDPSAELSPDDTLLDELDDLHEEVGAVGVVESQNISKSWAGFVYVMHEKGRFDRCKIGVSGMPENRVSNLRVGNPDARGFGAQPFKRCFDAEQHSHRLLTQAGRHLTGEWFRVHPGDALKILAWLSMNEPTPGVEGWSNVSLPPSPFTFSSFPQQSYVISVHTTVGSAKGKPSLHTCCHDPFGSAMVHDCPGVPHLAPLPAAFDQYAVDTHLTERNFPTHSLTSSLGGYVYVLAERDRPDRCKVGFTENDPRCRLSTLKVGNPELVGYAVSKFTYPRLAEYVIHALLQQRGRALEGEWFSCMPSEARRLVAWVEQNPPTIDVAGKSVWEFSPLDDIFPCARQHWIQTEISVEAVNVSWRIYSAKTTPAVVPLTATSEVQECKDDGAPKSFANIQEEENESLIDTATAIHHLDALAYQAPITLPNDDTRVLCVMLMDSGCGTRLNSAWLGVLNSSQAKSKEYVSTCQSALFAAKAIPQTEQDKYAFSWDRYDFPSLAIDSVAICLSDLLTDSGRSTSDPHVYHLSAGWLRNILQWMVKHPREKYDKSDVPKRNRPAMVKPKKKKNKKQQQALKTKQPPHKNSQPKKVYKAKKNPK